MTWTLPLDLEVRRVANKDRYRHVEITHNDYEQAVKYLITEWQSRYDATDKGEWRKRMIPDVAGRYALPLQLDRYTSQMLTGRGDFRAQLHRFRLVNSPNCSCFIVGAETVAHVLLKFKRTEPYRRTLKITLREEGEIWQPEDEAFLKSRKTYEGLRKFAQNSLRFREDR